MKQLYFDFISDVHVDHHVRRTGNNHEYFETLLPEQIGVRLIVAGDIGNYNDDIIDFLKYMSERYACVYFTLGNHEFYSQRRESQSRVNQLTDYVSKNFPNVTWLNGQVIEINGFKIGGTHMWYDGSYAKENFGFDDLDVYQLFSNTMNDKPMISPDVFKSNMIEDQRVLLRKIYKELDLCITHIPPIIPPNIPEEWKRPMTGFFSFDGREFMDGNIKVWIYGHTHKSYSFIENGIHFICNPVGYPGELTRQKICSSFLEK